MIQYKYGFQGLEIMRVLFLKDVIDYSKTEEFYLTGDDY
jgi:hypothetical protein